MKPEVLVQKHLFNLWSPLFPQKSSRWMENFHRNFSVTSHFRVKDDWLDFRLGHYLKATIKIMKLPPDCFPNLNNMLKTMLKMIFSNSPRCADEMTPDKG